MKKPISLRKYLLAQLGVVTMLQLVILSALIWLFLMPEMRTEVGLRHHALARTIAGQISAHLIGGERQLEALAGYLRVHPPSETPGLFDLFDTQCGNGEMFETIYLVENRHDKISEIGLSSPRRSHRNDLMGLDLSSREFLKSARNSKQIVWSETFLSTASSRLAMAVTIPIPGYTLTGEITVDQLSAFISNLPVEAGLFTMILDRRDRVVADSQQNFGGRRFDSKILLPDADDDTITSSKFNLDGKTFVGALVSIDQLSWKVVVAQPVNKAFRSVSSAVAIIGLGLAISFFLGLTASWFQTRRLTRTFTQYTKQTQAIANGDYDRPWPPSKTLEFADLAENLQRMVKTIGRRERQIAASENNLRIILDSIGDAVIATDDQGIITRMNPSAEHLTGWTATQAVGKKLPEVFHIVHAHTGEIAPNPVEKVLARGQIVGLANHTMLISRDGARYQIADSGAPIRQDDGRFIGVVLVFRDVTEAYVREQKIRESERMLKNITANVPGVVYQFQVDGEGAYTSSFVSEKAKEVFGFDATADEYFSAFLEHIPDNEKDSFLTSIEEAVARVITWHYEGRFIKDSGEVIWFSGNSIPHRDGTDIVFNGVLADITQRKLVEEENLKRRRFLESVLYHLPDAIITLDAANRVQDWNPGAVRIFGYGAEEAIGRNLDDLVTNHEFHSEAVAHTREVMSGRQVEAFETVRIRKDGSPVHVLAAGSPVMVDNQISAMLAVYRDITERKIWENTLEASERRFKALFNGAPMMYVVTESRDNRPYIQDVNQMFLDVLGFERHEVLGQQLAGFYTEESKRELLEQGGYQRALDGIFTPSERNFLTRDKRVVYTLLHAMPDYDAEGRVIGTRAMFQDITARKTAEMETKRLETALLHSQKMEAIGTLAGGIAHDFNNILSAVIGYSELALTSVEEDSRLHNNLAQILVAGTRARELVRQILTFSRQDELELKPLDIAPLIKEALKLLRSSLPTTIEIRQHISNELDNVMAEPAQIHRVIMNLCTNAAQAMEEDGGLLTVGASQVTLSPQEVRLYPDLKSGQYLKLSVQDSGPGIPPDIIDKIYNPYFTTKEKGKGTGLGLSVVHGIIQSYGGAVYVYSDPGQGTTFNLYIPAIKRDRLDENGIDGALPTGSEHILLVDDEPLLVEVGRQILEMQGYRVTTCRNGREALDRFHEAPDQFDLVITDMTMPKITGDKLAIEIMETRADLPVILYTGFTEKITDDKARKIGVKALLLKPVTKKDLAFTVRRVLDESRPSA